ncbi:nuclear transport factor 2 family protein [Ruegeria halocynthiae]|uniref:nuclear transport factor 2 family protein n=1 Tax=Ruegeria halocynthiae TaxID=985054 RepID=UPI0009DF3751|nr:nuclear transport factor 2 family protein [Ruegeria halocynthiae]
MNRTVKTYFDAFNAGNVDAMLACLSDDVAHHVNEGQIRVGKEKFAAFCAHLNRCYRETLTDIVVFEAEGGSRAAAEFIVNGTYLETDDGSAHTRHCTNCRTAEFAREKMVATHTLERHRQDKGLTGITL